MTVYYINLLYIAMFYYWFCVSILNKPIFLLCITHFSVVVYDGSEIVNGGQPSAELGTVEGNLTRKGRTGAHSYIVL